MPLSFQPMPLSRHPRPFNHPEWLFELKYDGFRALARIQRGQCELTINRLWLPNWKGFWNICKVPLLAIWKTFRGVRHLRKV